MNYWWPSTAASLLLLYTPPGANAQQMSTPDAHPIVHPNPSPPLITEPPQDTTVLIVGGACGALISAGAALAALALGRRSER